MLDPISPFHIPKGPGEPNEDTPLEKTQESTDNEGYSFRFFGKGKKIKKVTKKKDETNDVKDYNEEDAVNIDLSPEAIEKIERQRNLKKNINKKKSE
jgi:hypothetical protein